MSEVFRVDNLSKAFGGLTVSRDISLAMKEGARLALIGPNGAGKTTFVNLVTGQLRPDAGKILLSGEDVTRAGSVLRVRRGLVRTFQVTRLFSDMTPEEHVTLTVLQREGRASRILQRFRDPRSPAKSKVCCVRSASWILRDGRSVRLLMASSGFWKSPSRWR